MIELPSLTVEQLAASIDHTFLKPFGTQEQIDRLCDEARRYGFGAVAVNPAEVERCVSLLKGSEVKVATGIGFPLGQTTSECKAFEARDAIARGAGELDMMINIRALQSGDGAWDGGKGREGKLGTELVRREIEEMVAICKPQGVVCKVILETCYLTDEEKVEVCKIAREAGADFVKTSTGFAGSGATVHDVELMRRTVGPEMGVKASGGVRDLETALALIRAGATRIGTSSSVAIVEAYKELKNKK